MILIGEILVSEALVKERFVCDLNACKGACCIEGDYGAPLLEEETKYIGEILEPVKAYLSDASIQTIEEKGFYTWNKSNKDYETELMEDGACVFMGRNELGITFCAIEKAYYDGKIPYKKPISCHLYPIRVHKNRRTGFEALNYDEWDICSAACSKGDKENVRVFEFAKDAIIRKYGEAFYEELEAAAEHLEKD